MNHEKSSAAAAITRPLFEESPSEDTGPGSSHVLPSSAPRRSSTNPFRQSPHSSPHGSPQMTKGSTGTTRELRHSPRNSISNSPGASSDHRQQAFSTRPRRSSSLRERYPGDPSVRPLDQLAREKAVADKSRHMVKKHSIPVDTIDGLDDSGVGTYHHGGPYDATLLARNNSYLSSPVAAVESTNAEALQATPREKIQDSLERHRPLDGVAAYPPGSTDREGHIYKYEEGENMQVDLNPGGGAYKRWPGVQYHPDDIKGKGEPSYSIEKALKEHSLEDKYGRHHLEEGIEMQAQGKDGQPAPIQLGNEDLPRRSSGSFRNGLRQRVGSIKKKLAS